MSPCLGLVSRSYLGVLHFEKINWQPVYERVKSCIATTVFKYWNGIVRYDTISLTCFSLHARDGTQNCFRKLQNILAFLTMRQLHA